MDQKTPNAEEAGMAIPHVDRSIFPMDFVSFCARRYCVHTDHQALVLGVSTIEQDGPPYTIQYGELFVLDLRKITRVPLKECAKLSLNDVDGGLVGLFADHEKYGRCIITHEERYKGYLHFELLNKEGLTYSKVSISEIASFMIPE